jgi:hypothetical protein
MAVACLRIVVIKWGFLLLNGGRLLVVMTLRVAFFDRGDCPGLGWQLEVVLVALTQRLPVCGRAIICLILLMARMT